MPERGRGGLTFALVLCAAVTASAEQVALRRRGGRQLQVGVGQGRGGPAARGAGQKAGLDQERLVHVLDGVPFLAHGNRQGLDPHWPTGELLNDRLQDPAIHLVEPPLVHVQPIQRIVGHCLVNGTVPQHLGKIPHPA